MNYELFPRYSNNRRARRCSAPCFSSCAIASTSTRASAGVFVLNISSPILLVNTSSLCKKALQISAKEDVALPANWPENGLIKDHAIVPPASNVKDAEKRLKEYEGFDWWFCHKALK